jgi:predicted ABC-type transport system involved in lysophospholipase L1 biosynthesis ATPase subunit
VRKYTFKGFAYQRSALLMAQEIMESTMINLLRNGIKCAKHANMQKELSVLDLNLVQRLQHYPQQ